MSLKSKGMNHNSRLLFKNTLMLYILQFSTYLFSFITVPYQTRVLGPEIYGVLGVVGAVMMYFQLFMDFGFLLSATEDISKNRTDFHYVCKKLTSITLIKVVFAAVCFGVMAVLCAVVGKFAEHRSLYFIYLAAFVINSFLPDYVFRGLEDMSAVTLRTVLIKFISCIMVFVFLRTEEDYMLVPAFLLIGNAIAVLFAYAYLFKKFKYRFEKVTASEIFHDFKRSSVFFYSRIATTVYSATNTVVLGMVDQAGIITGCYTSADKVVNMVKNGLSPISDSLYPYMVKNRDFKLVKKILLIFMPIIVVGCAVGGIFAEPLCVFVFGAEYADAAGILRAFLPAVVATLPSYIFGFPTLGAMGLSKYANYSIFVGSIVHIAGIVLMLINGSITGVTLAAMTSVSEWIILSCRIIAVYRNRNIMKGA